jgi:hypothetical protein
MVKRIILAGVLGGIALFAWESVAHLALPLGEAGVKSLTSEDAVMAALKQNIAEPGFYIFPAPKLTPGMTSAQQQEAMRAAMQKGQSGPSGILVFQPNGSEALSPRQLMTQAGSDVAAMLLAAILLSWATLSSFAMRALFVTLLGAYPTLTTELSQWNWYNFPSSYTLAQFTIHIIGFLAGGLVVAALIKRRVSPA